MKTSLTRLSADLRPLLDRLPPLPKFLRRRGKRLLTRIGSNRWMLVGISAVLLWIWIWQWVLSIAIGLAVMVGLYLFQQSPSQQLQPYWQPWQKLWSRSNRSVTVSAVAGLAALGSTYLATAVWLESENHWLVTTILLEGASILAILGLLLWQMLRSQQFDRTEAQFQTHLTDLSDADPLKRLIAVRQLTQILAQPPAIGQSTPMTANQLAECFRLMLDRETEPLVCSALLDGLRLLQPTRQLSETQLESVSVPTAPHSVKAASKTLFDRELEA